MRTHRRRNRILRFRKDIGPKIFQRPSDNPPKPARRELALAGRFIDRDNPPDLERRCRLFLSLVSPTFFINVAKNLKLRLHDLQVAIAIFFDLAVERDHLSRLEAVLKISGIEPQALQLSTS